MTIGIKTENSGTMWPRTTIRDVPPKPSTILWCGANSDAWNRIPILKERGWDVTVFASGREIEGVKQRFGGDDSGVKFTTVADKDLRPFEMICSTIRGIRSVGHERLVCDLQGLRSVLAAKVLRVTRAPVTIVLLSPPISRRLRSVKQAAFGIQLLSAGVLGFNCAVLSDGVACEVRKLSLNTLDPVVTPPGVNTNHFSPGNDRISRDLMGVPSRSFLLSYHGVVHSTRRMDTLLRGLRAAFRQRPDLHLVIIGSGDDEERLKAIATDMGIGQQVHFLGQIAYKDLPRYIRAADVSVVPLPDDQSWSTPYKMLEAMACGKPVISSDVQAVREIAADSGCIRLVSDEPDGWSNVVLDLMASPDENARMSKAGREYVLAGYTWESSVDILERVLMDSDTCGSTKG